MKLDALTVELRPRTGWEAMELGSALVRRHARAIWLPWFLVTLPVWAAVVCAAYALELLALVPVFMWWLRPLFDRVPLYVLSRAVFGSAPSLGDTLRAQLHWGWRPMLGHLLWRRLSPLRAATLPVDLLEGMRGEPLRARRSVLVSGIGGQTALLTVICSNFILMMQVSLLLFGALLLIPSQFVPQVLQALQGELRWGMPDWLLLLLALVDYLALCLIEPFYIGAGFGLYLNRRTELEAWDLEIAFRRMRQRLLGAVTPLLALLLGAGLWAAALQPSTAWADSFQRGAPTPAVPASAAPASASPAIGNAADKTAGKDIADAEAKRKAETDAAPGAEAGADAAAQTPQAGSADATADADAASDPAAKADAVEGEDAEIDAPGLDDIFGEDTVGHGDFGKSVERAYANPDLRPKRTRSEWRPKNPDDDKAPKKRDMPALAWLGSVLAFLGKYGLWLLLAVLLVLLAATARTWLPWLRLGLTRIEEEPPEITQQPLPPPEPLPPDVGTAARRLWAAGEPRRALALLYRASVASMVERTGAVLPPGATESQCLRAARGLRDAEDRSVFQRMVRVWEYAAYGHRLPDGDSFEALVDALSQRFGWAA